MSTPSRSSGEFSFIAWLRRQVRPSSKVFTGIGDDAAVVSIAGDRLLLTIDALVEGTHFEAGEASLREIGRKAAATSLSDIAAMGGAADYVLVSAALGEGCDRAGMEDLYHGMAEIADEFSVELVGGDIVSGSKSLVVTVASVGHMPEGKQPVLRKGARKGDGIMVTGELGGSSLGRHLGFRPRLREAAILTEICSPSSMIDISDGLLLDLSHILEESGVGALVYEEAIPVSDAAAELAKRTGTSPLEHALSDGEDYELLFTVAPEEAVKLTEGEPLGVRVTRIGEVVTSGLRLRRRGGEVIGLEPEGYEHRVG